VVEIDDLGCFVEMHLGEVFHPLGPIAQDHDPFCTG
jgi:hypothetical protein